MLSLKTRFTRAVALTNYRLATETKRTTRKITSTHISMPPGVNMQMTNKTSSSLLANEVISDVKWSSLTHSKFRIGIVIGRNDGPGDHVLALSNPASSCCAVALTFLHPENVNVEEWCIKHRVDEIPRVDDLDMLLNNPKIDGVYISGAAE